MKFTIPLLLLFSACSTLSSAKENSPISAESQPVKPIITSTSIHKGEITGTVKDEFGESLPFAKVILLIGDKIITGTTTDLDGFFKLSEIEPGRYDIEVNYVGYSSKKIEGIDVNGFQKIDFKMIQMPGQEVILLKPVIYLYPEVKSQINVSMNYAGRLTHTYPTYPTKGWDVTAFPDGTLWDKNDMEYYALFWEGIPEQPIIPEDGFVISGNETVSFLEVKLEELGLNRRETNEFIMFWLPQMENNPYNFIHFASSEYEDISSLIITPKPETTIRVMMLTKKMDHKIDFPLQDISNLKTERKGFTVVEWGGSIIKAPLN